MTKVTTYSIVIIDGRHYQVAPACAQILESICRDERYQQMLAIPFDWLRLTVDHRGKSDKVEVAGG